MRKVILTMLLILFCAVGFGAAQSAQEKTAAPASAIPDLAQLKAMSARFAPTPLRVDTSALSAGDQKALVKLISRRPHRESLFYMQQFWSRDLATYQQLRHDRTPLGAGTKTLFLDQQRPLVRN